MLPIRVFSDYEALSQAAADWLTGRLRARPDALVCLAAGSTPAGTYKRLAQQSTREPSLVAQCRLIKLDEWGGLSMDDPATCEYQLRNTLVDPLGLSDRYIAFDGHSMVPEAECARVADWLKQNGPIDLCVLGLGVNGHLGFNEPADALQPHAHIAKLSAHSLQHPMLQQGFQRPTHGLTLGIADIVQSREVILLASGNAKRKQIRRLLNSDITPVFPASFLHLHPAVRLFCDEAAATIE